MVLSDPDRQKLIDGKSIRPLSNCPNLRILPAQIRSEYHPWKFCSLWNVQVLVCSESWKWCCIAVVGHFHFSNGFLKSKCPRLEVEPPQKTASASMRARFLSVVL
jgi:hypothetical protein